MVNSSITIQTSLNLFNKLEKDIMHCEEETAKRKYTISANIILQCQIIRLPGCNVNTFLDMHIYLEMGMDCTSVVLISFIFIAGSLFNLAANLHVTKKYNLMESKRKFLLIFLYCASVQVNRRTANKPTGCTGERRSVVE